ncbi:MAG: 50S ribosomal protein L35 [Bacilli bacterium]|jgi:ribosomal protein L35|nr:50S ribosomal protein L35 [Bacilli bacterium]
MPKIKTHKSTKKVLKVRPGGTITLGKKSGNHNTGKKSAKVKRRKKQGFKLSKADEKRLKSLI